MSFSPTILSQVKNQINRLQFDTIVKDNSGDKYVKRISCGMLLNLLIFATLSEVKSMRHLAKNLQSITTKLYHLGIENISLNGISHALSNRPSIVYQRLFYGLLETSARRKIALKSTLKKFISIIDATSIPTSGKGSEWAKAGRQRCEAKAHVLLDAHGKPLDMVLTGASVHDSKAFYKLNLGETEVLIMDRAYYGYNLWHNLSERGITFVTRAKKNIVYETVSGRRGRPPKGVLKDQQVIFRNKLDESKYLLLRAIKMNTEKGVITFITNDLQSPAARISELYKMRWDIEVFFKWIKQNLKIKRFLGKSQNAVETQLWVAMIVYLILHMIKKDFKYDGSILDLIRVINLKLLCHVGMADMLSPPKLVGYEEWKVGDLFDSSGQ